MKKIRSNRQFDTLNELADYLNYYFSKNPDAEVTGDDLKKIVDNNPQFTLEPNTVGNSPYRNIVSDSDGNTLVLTLAPRFFVFADDTFDEEPTEDYPEDEFVDSEEGTEEEAEADDADNVPGDDAEAEAEADVEAEAPDEDLDSYDDEDELNISGIREGDIVYWNNEDDNRIHKCKVEGIRSEDNKIHDDTTEIQVSVLDDGDHYMTSIFSDELVPEAEYAAQCDCYPEPIDDEPVMDSND